MRIEHWRDAERLAESWMRNSGFPGARRTGGSADAGIDVRAEGAIAQVKMEARPVGRPSLQRLVGARGTSANLRLLFFSVSGYTVAATEYARAMDISLLMFTPEGDVTPVNSHARTIRSASADSFGTSSHPAAPSRRDIRLIFAAILVFPFAVTWLISWTAGASYLWASVSACAVLALLVLALFGWSSQSDAKAEAERLAAVRAKRPGPGLFDV